MSFVSFGFLLFLALTILIYYIVPGKFQWIVILIANCIFYAVSGLENFAFIGFTTVLTYVSARMMQKRRDAYTAELAEHKAEWSKEEKKAKKGEMTKKVHRIQVWTVLIALLVLAVCKYTGFVVKNINSVFAKLQWDASVPLINMIIPLGISFYTFMAISYVIDIGRGKYEAEKNLGKYAAYISFFPTVVQGPICRYNEVGKQLSEGHKVSYNNLKYGSQLVLWGYFMKIVIADRASYVTSTIFASSTINEFSGGAFFFGVLMYAVQIYGDFSGGINITRGVAQMMGIDLPQNFERPYFSTSVSDYWRRWHITLGAFMREYVFYPVMLSKPVTRLSNLARKRISNYMGRVVPTVITPFVVFFLIGIWHGASWQFVAFGLYNSVVVAGGVALDPLFKKLTALLKVNTEVGSYKVFCIIRTFMLTFFAKILVISPSLGAALIVIKKIFTNPDPDFLLGLDGKMFQVGLDAKNMFVLFVSVLILFTVSVLQENGMKMRETIAKQNLVFRWLLVLGLLAVILIFGIYGPSYDAAGFIYEAY